jgi:hypothetical protein
VQFFHREAMRAIPGVVGVWPMNKPSGNEEDFGTGHDAVPSAEGLIRATPSLLPNREGRSCQFDGAKGFFSIAAAPIINLADTFSMSAWVRPIVVGSERVIFTLGPNGGELGIQGAGGKLLGGKQGVGGWLFGAVPTPDGTTVFVVITKNGAARHLYLNGVDQSELVADRTCESSEEPKQIGRILPSSFFYSGYLQYLGLYSTALTPTQVTTLWQSAHRGTLRATPIDPQLKALTG